MRADLHIHTTASDGCWTPRQTVEQVRAAGIELFAIADHDSLEGVPPAAELVRGAGLALLPGVEVSSLLNGRGFHILGYGVDLADEALDHLLAENRARMEWTDDELVRRLAKAGYPVDLQAYAAYQHDHSRGGWKALNFLIDAGLCRDTKDFFERLFVEPHRPPSPDFPHPAQVCQAIRAAGGLPVLAHPGVSWYQQGVSQEALAPFLEFGIAGLECYACHHDPATTQACLDFCARHDLLVTGGSDSHGGFVGRQLGVPVITLDDLRLGPLEAHVIR